MSDTKRKLALALKELLQEKPLKKITIQDIVERSHLTRQSFYYHFQDIYDVLELICQYELLDKITYREEVCAQQWLEEVILLVQENKWFYRKILLEVDWQRLSAKLSPFVEQQVQRMVHQLFPLEKTKGLENGRILLEDFMTSSIIWYLFRYAVSRKTSEKQTLENFREMMKLCGKIG